MDYPAPKIGYYIAECCMLDLSRIESAEDLADAEERILENDDCGALKVFASLAEAEAALGKWPVTVPPSKPPRS